eukprot:13592473-Heterocapsa_arctica.AAC.1
MRPGSGLVARGHGSTVRIPAVKGLRAPRAWAPAQFRGMCCRCLSRLSRDGICERTGGQSSVWSLPLEE